jgi:hypothetical protein
LRQQAALGADDAGGDRVVKAEGVAHRQHPLADLDGVGVTEARRLQAFGVDLDHGQVRLRVGTHDLGFVRAAVGQKDPDLRRVRHDVVVGHDVTVGANDEAAALPARRTPSLLLFRSNVDHGRRDQPGRPLEGQREIVRLLQCRLLLGRLVGQRPAARQVCHERGGQTQQHDQDGSHSFHVT